MIILPILATSVILFSLKRWENVLFQLGSVRVNCSTTIDGGILVRLDEPGEQVTASASHDPVWVPQSSVVQESDLPRNTKSTHISIHAPSGIQRLKQHDQKLITSIPTDSNCCAFAPGIFGNLPKNTISRDYYRTYQDCRHVLRLGTEKPVVSDNGLEELQTKHKIPQSSKHSHQSSAGADWTLLCGRTNQGFFLAKWGLICIDLLYEQLPDICTSQATAL